MKIAGMHSELVGISIDGRLHQWKWSSDTPFSLLFNLNANSFSEAQQQATTTPLPNNNSQVLINHPKSIFLQLINEKICGISTSTMRASCWTESGKIAAWLDESVDIPSTIKYQTPAQNLYQSTDNNLNIINNERILDMSTSNLFTVIRTNSGSIYWW
jgi:E3 ubiquitin-protein ligase EDD1